MNNEEINAGTNRYVSTAVVARALGVGVSTVKRWVDEGILPAHRTAGGHRKLLMSDVIRLARDGNLPQADLSQLNNQINSVDYANAVSSQQKLLQALCTGDTTTVKSLIHGAYLQGCSIEELADNIISPVMREIGHQWERKEIEIATEHRASETLLSVLYGLKELIHSAVQGAQPVAIGGAPEHDHYNLAPFLTKLVLMEHGWKVIYLGRHTPFVAFEDAIREFQPNLVWLSVSHLVDSERFIAEENAFFEKCQALQVPLAVGGRALDLSIMPRLKMDFHGENLSQFARYSRTLHDNPGVPRRGRPPLNGYSTSTSSN
jgi:excisionase family DNA binding protein